jgi:hypothetical protein
MTGTVQERVVGVSALVFMVTLAYYCGEWHFHG